MRDADKRGSLLGLLTTTLPADDAGRAFRLLGLALTDLRHCRAWGEVGIAGGSLHVEVAPAGVRSARSWLVHAHAVVEIRVAAAQVDALAILPPGSWDDRWTRALFGGLVFYLALGPAVAALRDSWTRIVRERSGQLLTGRLDLRPVIDGGGWVENRFRAGEVLSPLARYTAKRRRGDLLAYTPEQLGALALFYRARPRLARGAFGTWRGTSGRASD